MAVTALLALVGWPALTYAAMKDYAHIPAEDPLMRSIPNYHFKMLRDDLRNDAFYEGLRDAIVPNVSHVIDLGAGTCLLSMMAARLGARRVTAIERHPVLAGLCRELVQMNGYADTVHLINDFSTNVFVDDSSSHPSAVAAPADVLVSETFDSWIVEEGFFSSLLDLRSRGVITADATIVPSKASLHVQLVESAFSFGAYPATVSGFNYEPVRRYRPTNQFVENSLDVVHTNISESVEAFRFDFQNKVDFFDYCQYTHIPFTAVTDGVVHGAAFWFRMHLDQHDRTILTNQPGTKWSSWMQMLKLFEWGDTVMRAGERFNLLIGQMHARYVFANADKGQRIVKVFNKCDRPVDIFSSSTHTRPEDGLQGEEHYRFSFEGSMEYNMWVSFGEGERFQAVVRYHDEDPCEAGVDVATGGADCVRPQPPEYVVRDGVDPQTESVPLHHYTVSC